jgi:hypothetical protein
MMNDDEIPRPDNGSVTGAAILAVMLIVAGLGLMLWDDRPGGPKTAAVISKTDVSNKY